MVVVEGFALTGEEAYELLTEWNATCEPPWTEKELRHKIDDALKNAGKKKAIGHLLGERDAPAREGSRS